jgi:hypothetical protein
MRRWARPAALLLIGERGRDTEVRADGMIAVWTVAGRQRIAYLDPAAWRPWSM